MIEQIKIVLGWPPILLTLRAEQEKALRGTDLDMIERPYDGCGKCLLGAIGSAAAVPYEGGHLVA